MRQGYQKTYENHIKPTNQPTEPSETQPTNQPTNDFCNGERIFLIRKNLIQKKIFFAQLSVGPPYKQPQAINFYVDIWDFNCPEKQPLFDARQYSWIADPGRTHK